MSSYEFSDVTIVYFSKRGEVNSTSDQRIINNPVHMRNFLKKHYDGDLEAVEEAVEEGSLKFFTLKPASVSVRREPTLVLEDMEIGGLT